MEFHKLRLIRAGCSLSFRIDKHGHAVLDMGYGVQDRSQILLQVIFDQELAAQPLHPDRKDRDSEEVTLRNKPGETGQERIYKNDIQVTAMVTDEQDRPLRRDILSADHIQPDAHGKPYQPETELDDPETALLAEMRPFFPDQPLNTQDRE